MAEHAFELYSVTAACRESLSVKVLLFVQGEGDTHSALTRANSSLTRANSAWHFFLFFAASTPLARSTEMRSIMRETMFCGSGNGWICEGLRCAQAGEC